MGPRPSPDGLREPPAGWPPARAAPGTADGGQGVPVTSGSLDPAAPGPAPSDPAAPGPAPSDLAGDAVGGAGRRRLTALHTGARTSASRALMRATWASAQTTVITVTTMTVPRGDHSPAASIISATRKLMTMAAVPAMTSRARPSNRSSSPAMAEAGATRRKMSTRGARTGEPMLAIAMIAPTLPATMATAVTARADSRRAGFTRDPARPRGHRGVRVGASAPA
jgi:hypothetical protein